MIEIAVGEVDERPVAETQMYTVIRVFFLFMDTATAEFYTSLFVGSVRCV